jgi:RimJ/RimL family protein N-acetyltransferase
MDDLALAQAMLAFESARKRSEGPLTGQEVAELRRQGVPLVFDPVQVGWLRADTLDDIDPLAETGPPVLTLRPWGAQDAGVFRALLDDPAVWRYLPEGYPGPLSPTDAEALIALANDPSLHDVCALLADGVPVGQVRLIPATGEVSYWLGRAHWGRGLAKRALRDWTVLCRARHPGLALWARVHNENAASRRVAETAGYVWQGPDAADPRFGILAFSSGSARA